MHGFRREQITFSRFVAAVAIVIFHYGGGVHPFDQAWMKSIVSKANVGVSYFFVLSGFIMILAYSGQERIKVGEYYRSRIARIGPLYYVAFLVFVPSFF